MDNGAGQKGGSRETGRVLAVAVLALAVRLIYLYSYSRTPWWDALIMDPGNHWDLARRLAAGNDPGPYPYFRAPLYIWVLALHVKVFGESLWAVRIFQALLGSASAAMTYVLARRLMPSPFALMAGIIMAVYWVPVYFDGELLITGLATFLFLLGLLAVMRAEWRGWLGWILAGSILGLSSLARPNILVFALAVAVILLSRALRGRREWLVRSAAFSAGVILLVAPVFIRNLAVSGDPVLISSQGGINFWLGNHEGADGRTVVVPVHRRDVPVSFIHSRADHPWVYEDVWLSSAYVAEQETRSRMRDSEISSFWYGRAISWMRENPGRAAALLLRKTLFLFQAGEVSNNRDLDYHSRQIFFLGILRRLGFGLIAPFALAGAIAALGRWRDWRWPLTFLICYSATVAAFFVTSRYRAPLMPVLICLAAFWIGELTGAVRGTKGRPPGLSLASLVVPLVFFAVIVNMPLPRWNDRPLRSAMQYNLGIAMAMEGEWDAAESSLRSALDIKANYPEAHFWLGKVMEGQGRIEAAAAEFERCVEQDPGFALAHFELYRLYLARSESPGDEFEVRAMEHLKTANLIDPKAFPAPPR